MSFVIPAVIIAVLAMGFGALQSLASGKGDHAGEYSGDTPSFGCGMGCAGCPRAGAGCSGPADPDSRSVDRS